RELGIPLVMELPGVGQNLQDHLCINVSYCSRQVLPLPGTTNMAEGDCFIKTRLDLPAPDLQIIFLVTTLPGPAGKPIETQYWIVPVVLRPESRGTLTLASNDPLRAPEIRANYLDCEADVQVLVEGFKIARKIGQAKALDTFRER